MSNLYHLPAGPNVPEVIHVVIEVPRGSANKYEYDKELGVIKLDRVLYAAMQYPGDYGFIPSTLGGDGDPLDALILSTHPFLPGVLIECRVLGMLEMSDDKGRDEKILAVPIPKLTAFYDGVDSYTDLPPIQIAQIEHFFAHYKDLEPGKWTKLQGWQDADVAKKMIMEGIERANAEGFGYQG